jgi:hypothetical protein
MTASVGGTETRKRGLKRTIYVQNHQNLCIIFLLHFFSEIRRQSLSVSIVVALHTTYSSVNDTLLSILYGKPAACEFDMGRDININALNGLLT